MMVNNAGASHYSFHSSQTHLSVINGTKTETTESVHIQNGRGTKVVEKTVNGRPTRSKKALSSKEVKNIMDRKFMPKLFVPCHNGCAKQMRQLRKTKKHGKTQSK